MRLMVYNLVLSAILIISSFAASVAAPLSGGIDERQKKEKVQVVVVEKRDRDEKKNGGKTGSDGKEQRSRDMTHSRS